MIYGYARVSTIEQETTLQLDALHRAGADQIFQEKTSSVGKLRISVIVDARFSVIVDGVSN